MSFNYDYGKGNTPSSSVSTAPSQNNQIVPPTNVSSPTFQTSNAVSQNINNGQIPASQSPLQGENKTALWMGELEPWVDEAFIRQVWFNLGEQVNVKMIRDKFSGSNAGYCFVDFSSTAAASKALSLNGTIIPGTTRLFKLNWASGGGLSDRKDDREPEFSIFVGDLGPEVNEYLLVSLFQSRYPSCKSAKIMTDLVSGMSRGYGFVRFSDEMDQRRALTEMQGVYCGNRPIRISTATPKNKPGMNHMSMMHMGMAPLGYYGAPQPMNQFTDPNNTTVFVGGLSSYVTEDELRSFFQGFGEITYVKIPPGKGCGFVQFVQRHAAEMAINQMQGYPIGNSRVRLSWGRSQNNSGPIGTPYRPNPPPPVPYASLGLPPQHAYSNFAPINPNAAHMHPPQQPGQPLPAQPGQLSGSQNPMDPIPVTLLNELYSATRNARLDRLEADRSSFHGVYAQ